VTPFGLPIQSTGLKVYHGPIATALTDIHPVCMADPPACRPR
jgi:hypothetical protein